jgi:methyltransferase (TIGR00027 family)
MHEAKPSRTAMRVAMRRAAHQLRDRPLVLDDPIALRIIGSEAEEALRNAAHKERRIYARVARTIMAVRSRFAEDELARSPGRGVHQYVLLGAGLDTFAYRDPHPTGTLRVFEVDHPATQAWKQGKLAKADIRIPDSVTYAAVDFERQTLAEGLSAAGFDPSVPTFFTWLGVTMYLTAEAIDSTLDFVASMPKGSGIVFDYGVPRRSLNIVERFFRRRVERKVAKVGEPFITYFDPQEIAEQMRRHGFRNILDLGRAELNARYFNDREDGLRMEGNGTRLLSAEV